MFALVSFRIQGCLSEPSLIESKDGYATFTEEGMEMGITANMFRESVNEYDNGFGVSARAAVCSSIELSGLWSLKPGFCVRCLGRHIQIDRKFGSSVEESGAVQALLAA
jgi:hypothetical protein